MLGFGLAQTSYPGNPTREDEPIVVTITYGLSDPSATELSPSWVYIWKRGTSSVTQILPEKPTVTKQINPGARY